MNAEEEGSDAAKDEDIGIGAQSRESPTNENGSEQQSSSSANDNAPQENITSTTHAGDSLEEASPSPKQSSKFGATVR